MPNLANASLLEIVLTAMCAVLFLTSLINGGIIIYRGNHARVELEEEGRGDEWNGGPQKVFWQRVALVVFFILKGAFLTVLGVMLINTAPTTPANTAVSTLFGIETITLTVYATIYQIVIIIMRPGLDDDIIEADARTNLRQRQEIINENGCPEEGGGTPDSRRLEAGELDGNSNAPGPLRPEHTGQYGTDPENTPGFDNARDGWGQFPQDPDPGCG